jgi:hypothetical protein
METRYLPEVINTAMRISARLGYDARFAAA